MSEKDCDKQKKVKNWGPGGGMYRGVKASVKTLNYVIITLVVLLVVVVLYLSSTSSYTASYEMNGGEAISEEHYKYGDQLNVHKPEKTGYDFAGWYLDKDLTKQWDTKKDKVEGNVTLYAKWAPVTIRILFDINGGTIHNESTISPIEISFHEPYGELPTPYKAGTEFVGWQYNGEIIQTDTLVLMNGEHTLKAIFE